MCVYHPPPIYNKQTLVMCGSVYLIVSWVNGTIKLNVYYNSDVNRVLWLKV